MSEHQSDYDELRRNQVGLNSLDEPQISLAVRMSFGVSVGAVWGEGWVGSRMLRFFKFFTLLIGR